MHINRRRFLKGAGFAIGLPFLESLRARKPRAADAGRKRLIFWYQPDGDMEDKPYWFPTGTGTNFQFGEASAVLAPIKDDIIMLHGVHNGTPAGDCHGDYMPNMVTGGTKVDSIDQLIAAGMKPPTPFQTLEFGVATDQQSSNGGRLSFKGGVALFPEADPNKMFMNLFRDGQAGGGAPGAAPDPAAMQRLKYMQDKRLSILDGVLDELGSVAMSVSTDDRRRLDAHATSIRDFEKTLTALNGTMTATAVPADCSRPTLDLAGVAGQTRWYGGIDNASVPNLDKIAAVQQLLLMLALRCDLTRVATFMYNRSLSSQTFEFLPIVNKTTISHMFAHTWRTSPDMEKDFVIVKKWRASMFLSLIQALKSVPEGTGTMLDNTVVLWTCEMGLGSHQPTNIPFVIAGSGGGAFKTGRYLDYGATPGQSHGKLFVSLASAMGVQLPSFAGASGPLSGLTG
jgi:hypothetical protein